MNIVAGAGGRLEVFSSAWDQVDSKASLLVHYDNATEYRYKPESPFDREIEFFCRNIAAGVQGDQSRLTGHEVDELIETITKIAQRQASLAVQWRI